MSHAKGLGVTILIAFVTLILAFVLVQPFVVDWWTKRK